MDQIKVVIHAIHISRVVRKPDFRFLTGSNKIQHAQLPKLARLLKF